MLLGLNLFLPKGYEIISNDEDKAPPKKTTDVDEPFNLVMKTIDVDEPFNLVINLRKNYLIDI